MHLIWDYYIQLLQALKIPLFSRPIEIRPHNRNRSDKFLTTELDFEVFACVVIVSFGATFMCAWNFYFPSRTERLLWRCSSVFFLVFCAVGGSYTWLWHVKLFEKHKATSLPSIETRSIPLRSKNRLASKLKRLSPPADLPKLFLYPVSFFCVFYCLFRAYIFVEDVISLRMLPLNAYATVDWSQYVPHI